MTDPKYSIREIERRWLVDPELLPDLDSLDSLTIEDLYIEHSRMRLRKIQFHYQDAVQYKLCKKYGKISDIAEPIVNIYLDESEYEVLNTLAGKRLTRVRYHYPHQGVQFRICVIPSGGPSIVEAEFEDEETAFQCTPPPFCTREVSAESAFEAPELLSDP